MSWFDYMSGTYFDNLYGQSELPYDSYNSHYFAPYGGPASRGYAVDNNNNRVIPGFDVMGNPVDEETTRRWNVKARMQDGIVKLLNEPGGVFDQVGYQGPYGHMGGQKGFNPNMADFWGFDPLYNQNSGWGNEWNLYNYANGYDWYGQDLYGDLWGVPGGYDAYMPYYF